MIGKAEAATKTEAMVVIEPSAGRCVSGRRASASHCAEVTVPLI